MIYKKIETIDDEGNTWTISLTQDPKKTNRFLFSFFFNEKEFCLSRIQNRTIANMTWELLEKTKRTPKKSTQIENEQKDPVEPKKPKKQTKTDVLEHSDSELQSKISEKPKKRAKK